MAKEDSTPKPKYPSDWELTQLEHLLGQIATDINTVCKSISILEGSLEERDRQTVMYGMQSALEKAGCMTDFAYGVLTGTKQGYARGGIEGWFMGPVYHDHRRQAIKQGESA